MSAKSRFTLWPYSTCPLTCYQQPRLPLVNSDHLYVAQLQCAHVYYVSFDAHAFYREGNSTAAGTRPLRAQTHAFVLTVNLSPVGLCPSLQPFSILSGLQRVDSNSGRSPPPPLAKLPQGFRVSREVWLAFNPSDDETGSKAGPEHSAGPAHAVAPTRTTLQG